MSEPFRFLIVFLAAYRISRFITRDHIPLGPIRDYLLKRWESKDDGATWVEGLTCPWCIGAWVSFSLVAGLSQITSIPLPILYALAVSTLVGIIGQKVED